MIKYAALLRGFGPLNPNMRNEKLKAVFEKLGFKNVQTVVSSGNLLLESRPKNIRALEQKLEKALPEMLGFNSTTIIRNQNQLLKLLKKNPFKGIEDTPKSRLHVTFLKNKLDVKLKFPYVSPDKSYKLIGIYESSVCSVMDIAGTSTPALENQFGRQITTRTWKTVNKIINKF